MATRNNDDWAYQYQHGEVCKDNRCGSPSTKASGTKVAQATSFGSATGAITGATSGGGGRSGISNDKRRDQPRYNQRGYDDYGNDQYGGSDPRIKSYDDQGKPVYGKKR